MMTGCPSDWCTKTVYAQRNCMWLMGQVKENIKMSERELCSRGDVVAAVSLALKRMGWNIAAKTGCITTHESQALELREGSPQMLQTFVRSRVAGKRRFKDLPEGQSDWKSVKL